MLKDIMAPATLTALALGLFLTSCTAAVLSTDFNGTGHVIPKHDTDGIASGCLTVDGLWTTNDNMCGVFTGARSANTVNPTVNLSTSAGNCGIPVTFTCGSSIKQAPINIIDFGNGAMLWTGDLMFDFATKDANPPTGNQTSSLHLWGGSDSGNFYVLTWKGL